MIQYSGRVLSERECVMVLFLSLFTSGWSFVYSCFTQRLRDMHRLNPNVGHFRSGEVRTVILHCSYRLC